MKNCKICGTHIAKGEKCAECSLWEKSIRSDAPPMSVVDKNYLRQTREVLESFHGSPEKWLAHKLQNITGHKRNDRGRRTRARQRARKMRAALNNAHKEGHQ